MPRRAVPLVLVLLLMGAVLAAPAQAKCCPLDRIEITGPDIDGTFIVRAVELEKQLHPAQFIDLYWPALHGLFKGDERPAGMLGPAHEITYVLEGTEDVEPVSVVETVYLDALKPVAFTHEGQTHELYPGDVREVSWGWRPFPERAANALLFLLDRGEGDNPEGDMVSLEGDVVEGTTRSWLPRLAGATVGAIIAIGGLWFSLHRRRQATP